MFCNGFCCLKNSSLNIHKQSINNNTLNPGHPDPDNHKEQLTNSITVILPIALSVKT
jgi:hypothetical protein